MTEKQSLIYRNIEEALSILNAKDKGRYFICTCPECQQQEAFIYKNNMSYIQCNRNSECGERLLLRFEERTSEIPILKEHEKKGLNPQQVAQLKHFSDVMKLYLYNMESEVLDNGYRGLSRKTTTPFLADFIHEKGVQRMFEVGKELFPKDYSNNQWMCQRNLVMPILGSNGMVDRILLRSTINTAIQPKEIQLIVNPASDTRDFFVDVPVNAKTIVLGEALLDTLSFREIDKDIGIMALTGAAKTRRLCMYLVEHQDCFKDKHFLIAMDNDVAGAKAAKQMASVLKDIGANYQLFEFPQQINDTNAFLTTDLIGFKESYEKSVAKFQSNTKEKKKELNYER